jgi:hypothetical protein
VAPLQSHRNISPTSNQAGCAVAGADDLPRESPEEIKRFVDDAFAKGVFQSPSRPSVCYMLSMENLVPTDKGVVQPFPPHVMFYAPYLTNGDLGSDGNPAGPVSVAREGTRDATIIVPVAAHAGPSHAFADKRSGGSQ